MAGSPSAKARKAAKLDGQVAHAAKAAAAAVADTRKAQVRLHAAVDAFVQAVNGTAKPQCAAEIKAS